MVMVRLNHVTTRYNPLHYHLHPEISRFAPGRPPGGSGLARASGGEPRAFQGPLRPEGAKVLDDLSLTILPGETLSVVGPSGCGKSTLLRVVAGLIEPDTGEVYFDGRLMNGQPPRTRQIGMVFQHYALYPHMVAQENLGFFWRLRRKPQPEISAKVRQTAQILGVGFEALLGRFPRHLSGGEQQRVAVGRCIVREPSVFLLDEPFSNLDAHLRERSRRELKKLLMAFAVTTVFVTHDQHEAIAMGDRIAVMRDGKIVQVGPLREMYEDPYDSFVAGFLGDPPISLLACRYGTDTHSLYLDGGGEVPLGQAVRGMEHGQEVLLGVRAEHIYLTSQAESETMRGRVSHVEPRIADRIKIVYLELASQVVAAKVPYATSLTIGAPVVVRFDPGRLLLFNAQTHRRLHLVYQHKA
jgi:ABC-type sugar transport system ATPase subunit